MSFTIQYRSIYKLMLVVFLAITIAKAPLAQEHTNKAQPALDQTAAARTKTAQTEIAQTETTKPNKTRATKRLEKIIAKLWWNQAKKIKELDLSEAQRTQMDAVLKAYLQSLQDNNAEQNNAFTELGNALANADQELATKSGDKVVAALSTSIEQQIKMMIDIVALLKPEQREELISRYPKLLSRLWIHSPSRMARLGSRLKRQQ